MSTNFCFDGQVAIITGSGAGLGRAYAHLLTAHGAKVIVNDVDVRSADQVVHEIRAKGGVAVTNYDSVTDGAKVVATALAAFGRVDIVINMPAFSAISVHLDGSTSIDRPPESPTSTYSIGFAVTRAAWPHMRDQNFGRIVNIAFNSGLYGIAGQANYGAVKAAMVGFTKALAKEGARNNIKVNAVAPGAGSSMTATVLPEEVVKQWKPEYVAPTIAFLAHESVPCTGAVFESGGGWVAQVMLTRSEGHFFDLNKELTIDGVAAHWKVITDFDNATDPEIEETTPQLKQILAKLRRNGYMFAKVFSAASTCAGFIWKRPQIPRPQRTTPILPSSTSLNMSTNFRFDGQVAIVTGSGAGLGRAYAHLLAAHGAKVVVNDVGGAKDGAVRPADQVVNEIRAKGGVAVANYDSVTDGAKVVATALDAFGRVDIVINNAGILRDRAFHKMTRAEWDAVKSVHLDGSFAVTHAAWPHMRNQKYGRIVNITSINGLYGQAGQANYASVKAAMVGFTKALAKEGARNNIKVNAVAPGAGSSMTATVLPEEVVKQWKPEYVAPTIAFLAHESVPCTGAVFESGGGWVAQVKLTRSEGHFFDLNKELTIDGVAAHWKAITDFGNATDPEIEETTPQLKQILAKL
ncbi:Aste57867_13527 [Aphanomyces stellatus]|uniref:Aste57867_13527 protein n=1 Tax=Aphanomyces stellatus TaxID=120398 RepID=A0A485KYC6_9STRA|nr:hypothetical protein As57867_013477 [Aphanomyces stellatus]VFT90365.1 Aste57867_13527 [Aphanomyces stellatus]